MVAEPDQRIDAGLQHLESLSGTESEHPPDESDINAIACQGITIQTIGIRVVAIRCWVRRAHEPSIAGPRNAITRFIGVRGDRSPTAPAGATGASGAQTDRR